MPLPSASATVALSPSSSASADIASLVSAHVVVKTPGTLCLFATPTDSRWASPAEKPEVLNGPSASRPVRASSSSGSEEIVLLTDSMGERSDSISASLSSISSRVGRPASSASSFAIFASLSAVSLVRARLPSVRATL